MSKRIVVVEDDTWHAAHYKRIFKSEKFDVFVAHTAYEAIDLIDEKKPNAIVLDLLLSGTTGITLLNELQSHEDLAHIPVIVVTNSSQEFSQEVLQPYGVTHILDKATLHPNDVVGAIKRVTA